MTVDFAGFGVIVKRRKRRFRHEPRFHNTLTVIVTFACRHHLSTSQSNPHSILGRELHSSHTTSVTQNGGIAAQPLPGLYMDRARSLAPNRNTSNGIGTVSTTRPASMVYRKAIPPSLSCSRCVQRGMLQVEAKKCKLQLQLHNAARFRHTNSRSARDGATNDRGRNLLYEERSDRRGSVSAHARVLRLRRRD